MRTEGTSTHSLISIVLQDAVVKPHPPTPREAVAESALPPSSAGATLVWWVGGASADGDETAGHSTETAAAVPWLGEQSWHRGEGLDTPLEAALHG